MLVERRNIVIGGGDDLFGAEYFQAAFLKPFECLRAGDFMNKMFIDIQYRRAVVDGFNDMLSQIFSNNVFGMKYFE